MKNIVTIQGGLNPVADTTVGQRVYLVRLACGDGVRKAEPMREFAERLSTEDEPFYASAISDIENDKRAPSLAEINQIASVDPLKRGRSWLAWGDEGGNSMRQVAEPSPAPTADQTRTPWRETVREILPPIQRSGSPKKRRPKDDRSAIAS